VITRSAGYLPARMLAEAAKLEKLLARNSLDARRQFGRLRDQLPAGAFREELKALHSCIEKLDFKKARSLLARFPGRTGEPQLEERDRL
jgi:two-component system, sensor histidine kinase and response regulator